MADGTIKEYRYPRHAAPNVRYETGTVGALLGAYRLSSDWLGLSKSTQASRNSYLRHLEELHAYPADEIKRHLLCDMADAIRIKSGPAAANGFISATKKLYNWAIERGKFDRANPTFKIKKYPEGKLPAFSREDWDKAEQRLPEPLRRVLVVGRYTGQRRGDLVRLTWGHYDGTMLRFTQQKTGVAMAIYVHPDLKAELDAWKAEAEGGNVVSLADKREGTDTRTILTNFEGGPWHPVVLTRRMAKHLERIGLREKGERGLNTHGLRKMAAAVLAEEGASIKEIQGVTGHQTLAMIQLYTESADRERLGKQAIMRLPQRSDKLTKI